MRSPSIPALMKTFRLERAQASLVKLIAKAHDEGGDVLEAVINSGMLPKTARYERQLHSSPYGSSMWRTTMALAAIDEVLGTHGVETLGRISGRNGPPFEYLNMGDTYAMTLVYKRASDNLFISSWGDVVERNPKLLREDE